jgi:hypothetical protein
MPDSHPAPLVSLRMAMSAFVSPVKTQSQQHIRPLHRYVAARLVLEGGYHPDEVTPHPPLAVRRKRGADVVEVDAGSEDGREATLLGGLKSKDVDVVVCKPGVGPVLAVSVKGTTGAFRNLTNRMEEAIGDSTNIHIMYPGLVYGFLHVISAHGPESGRPSGDWAVDAHGLPLAPVRRYGSLLENLTGRRLVRDDYTRYEAVALALVVPVGESVGTPLGSYPESGSPLAFDRFFSRLYETYDLRFPYPAPSVAGLSRLAWSEVPAGLQDAQAALGYTIRVAG